MIMAPMTVEYLRRELGLIVKRLNLIDGKIISTSYRLAKLK